MPSARRFPTGTGRKWDTLPIAAVLKACRKECVASQTRFQVSWTDGTGTSSKPNTFLLFSVLEFAPRVLSKTGPTRYTHWIRSPTLFDLIIVTFAAYSVFGSVLCEET